MKLFRNIFSILLALVLVTVGAVPSFAASTDNQTLEFEYSSDSIAHEIAQRIQNGETNFVVEKTYATGEPDVYTDVAVEIDITNTNTRASSGTINWSITGRYYFASDDETISNYGNRGSADYSGSTIYNEQWDAYHTVTYKYSNNYEARCSTSEAEVTDEDHGDGTKFNAPYRLKNKNTGNWADNTAIYIIVYVDGYWFVKGNYTNVNVN